MARLKNILITCLLTLIVLSLAGGLIGFIRYSQISFNRTVAASDKNLAKLEYQSRVILDMRQLTGQAYDISKALTAGQTPADPKMAQALKALQADCELSLRGLDGKIDPALNYAKAMQPPAGASAVIHERYRQAVSDLLTLVTEAAKKNTDLTTKEGAELAKNFTDTAGELEGSLKTL